MGTRGAAPALVKRKTGIWHKHRRIAASEAALVALMSLYAPWIQPGHSHEAKRISLPLTAEHLVMMDGTRTALGLRELTRSGRKRSQAPVKEEAVGEDTRFPQAVVQPVGKCAMDQQRRCVHNHLHEDAAGSNSVVADRRPQGGIENGSNACQLLAVADRHSDLSACHILSLRYTLLCCTRTVTLQLLLVSACPLDTRRSVRELCAFSAGLAVPHQFARKGHTHMLSRPASQLSYRLFRVILQFQVSYPFTPAQLEFLAIAQTLFASSR